MKITRTNVAGTTRTLDLDITPEQWARYENGELIQHALGHLSGADREFIMTGNTQEDWERIFKEPES